MDLTCAATVVKLTTLPKLTLHVSCITGDPTTSVEVAFWWETVEFAKVRVPIPTTPEPKSLEAAAGDFLSTLMTALPKIKE